MRHILTIIFLAISFTVFGQDTTWNQTPTPMTAWGYKFKHIQADSSSKFLKAVVFRDTIYSNKALGSTDSSTRVPNTKWVKQQIASVSGGGDYSAKLDSVRRRGVTDTIEEFYGGTGARRVSYIDDKNLKLTDTSAMLERYLDTLQAHNDRIIGLSDSVEAWADKYFLAPLLVVNDSTVGLDTSRTSAAVTTKHYVDSLVAVGGGGSSEWIDVTGGHLYTLKNVSIGSSTIGRGLLSLRGATSGTADKNTGLKLTSSTAATNGNQKVSPIFGLFGNGWSTAGGTSDSVGFQMYVLPTQGSTAGGTYTFQWVNPVGVASTIFTMAENGAATYSGNMTFNGTSDQTFMGNLYFGNTTTRRYLWFSDFTSKSAVFGQDDNTGDFQFRVNNATSLSTGTNAVNIQQSTGALQVGTTTTDYSAITDVVSTVKGALPFPRMTTTQRDSINLTVTSITVTNGGTGYTSNPTITATTAPFGGLTATFGIAVRSGNVITSVPVSVAGSYNTTPTITVTGGGGSGAILTPVMTQVLTAGLTIYNTTVNKTQVWNGTTWNDLW